MSERARATSGRGRTGNGRSERPERCLAGAAKLTAPGSLQQSSQCESREGAKDGRRGSPQAGRDGRFGDGRRVRGKRRRSSGRPRSAPRLAFDIPRRILQEYCEPILNKRSIKAVGRLWSYGWHIDRYGLRVAGPRYALSIDPRSLSKIDSEYSLNKRAVCAGKYQVPGVVVILRSRAPGARGSP